MFKNELVIAGRKFRSRLMVGTGKFSSSEAMAQALEASGAEIVTVALRRVDINNPQDDIIKHIDKEKYLLLPNTSGARDAEEAVRLARIARAAGCEPWVKLEVTPDPYYLMPDPIETFKAAEILVKDGFKVLPYINADPVLCKRLEEIGTVTVMPLGAPIGSNKGLTTVDNLRMIIEQAKVPVVVDAGIGRPSHAAMAIELGADSVLVNTAMATAKDPAMMARSFKLAVEAACEARAAGMPGTRETADASSPLTGFLRN